MNNNIRQSLEKIYFLRNEIKEKKQTDCEKIKELKEIVKQTLSKLTVMWKQGALPRAFVLTKKTTKLLFRVSKKLDAIAKKSPIIPQLQKKMQDTCQRINSSPVIFLNILDIDFPDENGTLMENVIQRLKEDCPIITTRSIINAAGLDENKKDKFLRLKEHLIECQTKWEIFLKDEFVIFLPKNLFAKGKSPKRLFSLDLNIDADLHRTDVKEILTKRREKAQLTGFFSLFSEEPSVRKLFFLNGHGLTRTGIGGFSIGSYRKFLDFLTQNNTAGLAVQTCYAGGINAFVHQKGKNNEDVNLKFPVFLQSIGEFGTRGNQHAEKDMRSFMNDVVGCMDTYGGLNKTTLRSSLKKCEKGLKKLWNNEIQVHLPHHPSAPLGFRPIGEVDYRLFLDVPEVRRAQLNLAKTPEKTSLIEVERCNFIQMLALDAPLTVKIKKGIPVLLSLIPGNGQHMLDHLVLKNYTLEQFIEANRLAYQKIGKVQKAFFINRLTTKEECVEGFVLFASSTNFNCLYKNEKECYTFGKGKSPACSTPFSYAIEWHKMVQLSSINDEAVRVSTGGQECKYAFNDQLKKRHLKFEFLSQNETSIIGCAPGLKLRDFQDLTVKEKEHLFFWAASFHQWELFKDLLDTQLDVDAVDEMGRTSLYKACAAGQKEIVELLIKMGASVNLVEKKNQHSPLHIALIGKHKEIVKNLLKVKGVDLHVRDVKGKTPLFYALKQEDLLEMLLDFETDKKLFSHVSDSGIDFTLEESRYKRILDLLIKKGKLDIDVWGPCLLNAAINSGQLRAAQYLLQMGAHGFKEDVTGKIPFIYSIEKGCLDIAFQLLNEKESFIYLQKDEGKLFYEALIAAIKHRNFKVIERLLESQEKAEPKKLLDHLDSVEIIANSMIESLALKDREMLEIFKKLSIEFRDPKLKSTFEKILLRAIKYKRHHLIDIILFLQLPLDLSSKENK